MKTVHRKLVAAIFAAAVAVSGCGGSDDDSAGALTAFSVSPDSITIGGPDADTCAGPGMAGRVFIHGGAGPYRVENTFPDLLATTGVTYSDTQAYFDVFLTTSACLDPGVINVVDQAGRVVTVEIVSEPGEEAP